MGRIMRVVFCLLLAAAVVHGADGPEHTVLGVDSADKVRIRYIGVPLQVKLANLQVTGADSEKQSLQYLQESLKPGSNITIEMEPDANKDNPTPPLAHLFAGSTHINLEMIKRGLARFDGASKKFGASMQAAQQEAMTKKVGVWGGAASAAKTDTDTFILPPPKPLENTVDLAPNDYNGPVVADLSSKEYHYPLSRYAKSIRDAARIEYKSPAEAERAGKAPSPFSFPERAKAKLEKQTTSAGSPAQVITGARKAYSEAQTIMLEARKASKSNSKLAAENWKKAAKILSDQLNHVVPLADADPNNQELQKLTEEMSMSLYSCNKYQSL